VLDFDYTLANMATESGETWVVNLYKPLDSQCDERGFLFVAKIIIDPKIK